MNGAKRKPNVPGSGKSFFNPIKKPLFRGVLGHFKLVPGLSPRLIFKILEKLGMTLLVD